MAKLSVTRTVPVVGDAADVVAAEIEQHQMFGALLLVGEEFGGEALVLGLVGAAPARAGDRADRHLALAHAHENFRARADDLKAAEVEEAQKRRRIDAAQRAIEREGGQSERRGEALRQHHLKDVAGANIFLGALDHLEEARGRGVGHRLLRQQQRIGLRLALLERRLQRRDHGVEPRERGLIGGLGRDAGCGRAGVTTMISSRTVSNTTITVGRSKIASGTPSASGLAGGRRSISRTVS